jgi:ornithine decarboxylase
LATGLWAAGTDATRSGSSPHERLRSDIARFLHEANPPTPCLVISLDVVAERYRALADALPGVAVYYAVKANPEPDIVGVLRHLGARFDVASPAEVDLCLEAGADPAAISYGNTIKKAADIAYAYARGVRLFAFDSVAELEKIAVHAPGATVFCRILTTGEGADWPLSRKFGCDPAMAVELLIAAADAGLDPWGVSFHVGSQQRDVHQWGPALRRAADVATAVHLGTQGRVQLRGINLGGGFPAHYLEDVPPISAYAEAIGAAYDEAFPLDGPAGRPALAVEPGRYVVGDAGVLHTEVVLVSRKSAGDDERWVYLDTGVFGGLAETLGEAIKYRMLTSRDGGAVGPVVLAGPTCDSLDVMYQRHRYELPMDLQAGDRLTLLSAGAYTKAYCTDGFNGFRPMPAHCLPLSGE